MLAELGLRAAYDRPWYEQLVEEQLAKPFRVKTSKDSLRDREYATPKPPGHVRILLLGDSFTVGHGVADRDAIFAERVERDLNERLAADSVVRRIDVLNGGLEGSLTDAWVELYEHVEDTFEPDVVIAVFFLRDGTRTSSLGAFFGPIRREIVARNEGSWLYQRSFIYRFYRDARDRDLIASRYTQVIHAAYLGNEAETEEWRIAQRNLLELRDRARSRSAGFGLVVFPVLAGFDEPTYPFADVSRAIVSFAEEQGMPVLDLSPAFSGQDAATLWVSAHNQHPNEAGHAIAADALLPFLTERLAAVGTAMSGDTGR